MKPLLRLSAAFLLGSLSFVPVVVAQQHPSMPAGMTHEEHMAQMKKEAEMKEHGQMAMGFDQDKATHRFTLTATGGAITVDANDPADQVTRDQIQAHLQEIAATFGRGDFGKPLMTHGEVPTGVSGMQRHKSEIDLHVRRHRARRYRPDCHPERRGFERDPRLPAISNHGARHRRLRQRAEVTLERRRSVLDARLRWTAVLNSPRYCLS